MNINRFGFLWPEEERLAQHILKLNERALAWTESERGKFREDYFAPVKIPTIAHAPWIQGNIPIPTGIMDDVIELLKQKIAAGVYEPSDTSYRSRWFCVKKKSGALRIIHDLQPLNAVTIRNAAMPPLVNQFVESMAVHACYSMLDLFVGYDHRTLDTRSHNLTSFQTPLGARTGDPSRRKTLPRRHGHQGPHVMVQDGRWRIRNNSRKPKHPTIRVGAPQRCAPRHSPPQTRQRDRVGTKTIYHSTRTHYLGPQVHLQWLDPRRF